MVSFTDVRALCAPIALACLLSACGDDDNSQASSSATPAALQIDRTDAAFRDRRNRAPATPPRTSSAPVPFNPDEGTTVELDEGTTVVLGDPSVSLSVQEPEDKGSAELTWESANVDSCKASGGWEGTRPTAGNDEVEITEAGDHTFLMTCEGEGGSAVAMVTVSLTGTEVSWVAPEENTDGSELTDLAGYNLYYGLSSGDYTEVVPVNNPSQTSFDLPIEPGEYYMAMTAYDFDGNESAFSNEIVQVIN